MDFIAIILDLSKVTRLDVQLVRGSKVKIISLEGNTKTKMNKSSPFLFNILRHVDCKNSNGTGTGSDIRPMQLFCLQLRPSNA